MFVIAVYIPSGGPSPVPQRQREAHSPEARRPRSAPRKKLLRDAVHRPAVHERPTLRPGEQYQLRVRARRRRRLSLCCCCCCYSCSCRRRLGDHLAIVIRKAPRDRTRRAREGLDSLEEPPDGIAASAVSVLERRRSSLRGKATLKIPCHERAVFVQEAAAMEFKDEVDGRRGVGGRILGDGAQSWHFPGS